MRKHRDFLLALRQRPNDGAIVRDSIRQGQGNGFGRSAVGLVYLIALLLSTGCGSLATAPKLGSISVTDPSGSTTGQLASVVINAKAAISVVVSNDSENLGVSWVANCGGSPISPPAANPCGTIAPAYVGSTKSIIYTAPAYIPVGSTVRIVASAASDPSVSSTVTLTIAPLPITIALTTPPPSAVGASSSTLLSATVTNDLVAAGVSWSVTCGSASCGTFKSGLSVPTQTASGGQITYTAPSSIPTGGTVVITATSISDPTKSASAMVTIAPIAVTVAPANASVAIRSSASLVATVAFDAAGNGVDWSQPVCGTPAACGSISPSHTASNAVAIYTPPAAIPAGSTVTITASSTSNPASKSNAVITVVPPPPIVVTVTPPTTFAQVNGTTGVTAVLQNDVANLGVDWTLTCGSAGACGSIAAHTANGVSASYVAPTAIPAGGIVTATAVSTADKTKSATSVITIVPGISIAFSSVPPGSVTAGIPASFSATVTNDVNGAGVDWNVTCTSSPCGTLSSGNAGSPSHTASGASISYTAPIAMAAGQITISASSTASSTALPIRVVSTIVNVIPVTSVSFVPYAPSQVQQSDITVLTPTPVSMVAVVNNDSTNAGVDWSVCSTASTCGRFQVVPAQPATASTSAINATYAATVHTLSGQAALYVPPSVIPVGGTVTLTAKAHNPAATSPLATATAAIGVVASPTGVALQGKVLAGTKPVAGSAVYLYAAGASGYGSASSPLTFTTGTNNVATGSAGQFSIPAGYSCPSQSSQMFLVSLGGNAGAGVNPNLAMMSALGPCSGLSYAANLTVNEVTTVASVWALAPFMTDYGHVGSSAANANAGLANAFAAVNNLVDVTSGLPLLSTPAANGVVPRAEINTLASLLNTCTSTAGGAVGDGSQCGAFFNAANPGAIPSTAPLNTVAAALNIAQAPYFNTTPGAGSLYSLLPSSPAFSPVLTAAPNDWTIALSFSGGGLGSRSAATALAVDGSGNLWVTNSRFSSVSQFSNLGAALSPTGTGNTQSTAGGYQGGGLSFPTAITIDPLGNAWVANSGSLSEIPANIAFTYTGSLSGSSFSGGGLGSQVKGIASDGSGNIWAVTSGLSGALSWFAGTNANINGTVMAPGTALSPSAGFVQGINAPSGAIGLDTAGTVWVLNSGNNTASEYTSTNGAFLQTDYGYTATVPTPINSVLSSGVGSNLAIDNAGDVFVSPGAQLIELAAGGSAASAGGLGSASTAIGVNYSQFLALDGVGHVWSLITGGSTNCVSSYSVAQLSSSGAQLNVNPIGCGYIAPGVNASAAGIAVDGSGDVWVLNGSSLTELIGVAAPVVTPLAAGILNKTLAKRP